MATPPDLPAVKAYLGPDVTWGDSEITEALTAETAAQARACRIPDGTDAYPADLDEALCRRVAHNLALRGLPLGVQASVSDMAVATTRVGGMDAEVRRLEGPWRKVMFG